MATDNPQVANNKQTTFIHNNFHITRETFEAVYNLYWSKVYAVCYNNIKEAEIAKELVQDIFKSLWERREELQLENAGNYLIRAAKFKTFEYIRNKVSQQQHLNIKLQNTIDSTNCTEEHILYNELKIKVDSVVETLPAQCRRVYKMSREKGMSNKEIAFSLFISERAVEYHITKALSVLKLNLADLSR